MAKVVTVSTDDVSGYVTGYMSGYAARMPKLVATREYRRGYLDGLEDRELQAARGSKREEGNV